MWVQIGLPIRKSPVFAGYGAENDSVTQSRDANIPGSVPNCYLCYVAFMPEQLNWTDIAAAIRATTMSFVRALGLTSPFALAPTAAHAISGETANAVADIFVWVVLVMVPILVVWLFWKVHVMPEVIAEKRQHPQKEAIKTMCLLSLVFGGLLWPVAWLWASVKPVGYKLAYGRDKHDDYYAQTETEPSPLPASFPRTPDQRIAQLESEVALLKVALNDAQATSNPVLDKQHDSTAS